jgi:hypothetical protein
VIEAGRAGTVKTVTDRLRAVLNPHALFAATEIVPPTEPRVAVIDSEFELPVHPDGKVHTYEVAPGTDDIL